METLRVTWLVVVSVCQWMWVLYLMLRIFAAMDKLAGDTDSALQIIQKELWWVTVHVTGPVSILSYLTDGVEWYDYIFFPINLWIWWQIRENDDHDDRWKKRRKKVVSVVKVVAGKLVVVPLPGPSPA